MEPYEDLLQQAQREYQIAEHLLHTSYPIVKDPRMLPSILQRIYNALDYALTALLRYERNQKRIAPYEDTFESKLATYRNVNPKSHPILQEVRNLLLEHQRSPVEFARKENLILWEQGSQVKTLHETQLRGFLTKTKVFIDDTRTQLRTQLLKNVKKP